MTDDEYDIHMRSVADQRSYELLMALQAAVNGEPRWRFSGRKLLRDIAELRLPKPATERQRELDARKRAAEITHGA